MSFDEPSLEAIFDNPTPEQKTRLRLLEQKAKSFASERGRLLAAISCDERKCRHLEEEFDSFLSQQSDLMENLRLSENLDRLIIQTEDKSRSEIISQNIALLASDLGYAQARSLVNNNLKIPDQDLETYLAAQQDLIIRSPELSIKLTEIRKSALTQGYNRWEQANRDASKIYRAIRGLGTDEITIYSTLQKQDQKSASALQEAYFSRYQTALKQHLRGDFSGNELKLALLLLEGDKIASASHQLFLAIRGAGTAERIIKDIFKSHSFEEIKQIRAHFNEHYAAVFGAASLDAAIADELSGSDLSIVMALNANNTPRVAALELNIELKNTETSSLQVISILSKLPIESMQKTKECYLWDFRKDLEQTIKARLTGLERDYALALLAGKKHLALAAAIACTIRDKKCGFISKSTTLEQNETLHSILDNTEHEFRRQLTSTYYEVYGKELSQEIRSRLSGVDLDSAEVLLNSGTLSDCQRIRLLLLGSNANNELLRSNLKEKSRDEIAAILIEYKLLYQECLLETIYKKIKGDFLFDTLELLRGVPESISDIYSSIERQYLHEKKSPISRMIALFSKEAHVFEAQFKAIKRYYEQTESQIAESMLTESQLDDSALPLINMRFLYQLFSDSALAYRIEKQSVGILLSLISALIALVSVILFTYTFKLQIEAGILLAIGASLLAQVYTMSIINPRISKDKKLKLEDLAFFSSESTSSKIDNLKSFNNESSIFNQDTVQIIDELPPLDISSDFDSNSIFDFRGEESKNQPFSDWETPDSDDRDM